MGRSIIYDDDVKSTIDQMLERKLAHFGLIIGQRTTQKDFVIRLCPVPRKEEIAETSHTSKKKKESPELDFNEAWVCQFAKEVTRTLSGGFDVLGLYIISPPNIASDLNAKLRLSLYAMFKTLRKDHELALNSHITDNIILQICTVSLKCICRTYDIANIKSTPTPADWKHNTRATAWHGLQSQVAVDLKHALKSSQIRLSIQRQIDSSLTSFVRNVRNSIPFIDNELRDSKELLDVSGEGKKSKQKQTHKGNKDEKKCTPQKIFKVDLLIPVSNDDETHSQTFDGGKMLTFKGTLQCRAFVHNKATVEDAVQAMKQDVVRSITAHCEIHCQDLLVIDEEQDTDPVVVYELPRRVFAPLPNSNILVSDYQFHSNSPADSLDAFKELLNLELNESDIETTWESSPDTCALIQPEENEDRLSEFGVNQPAQRNVILPVAGAAIAALAAGLSYLLFLNEA